jgi:hypothetical protein
MSRGPTEDSCPVYYSFLNVSAKDRTSAIRRTRQLVGFAHEVLER